MPKKPALIRITPPMSSPLLVESIVRSFKIRENVNYFAEVSSSASPFCSSFLQLTELISDVLNSH